MADFTSIRRRKWLLIALMTLAIISALLVSVRILAGSSIGRSMLETRVEALAIRGQSIKLEGLEGDILGRATLQSLTLSDAQGEWLALESVALGWKPFALIKRTVDVRHLSAAKVIYRRPPVLAPVEDQNPPGGSSLPIDRIVVGELSLRLIHANLPGTNAPLEAQTSAAIDIGKSNGHIYLQVDTPDNQSGDRADVDLVWTDALVEGKADILAPNDGVIMSFLPPDMRDELIVSFNAERLSDAWTAAGDIKLGDHDTLAVRGSTSGTIATVLAEAQIGDASMTAPLAKRIGAQANLRAVIDFKAVEKAATEFSFDSPAIGLRTSGIANLKTRKLRDRWQIQVDAQDLPALSGLSELSTDSARFIGGAEITNSGAVALDGELNVENFALGHRGAQTVKLHIVSEFDDGVLEANLDLAASSPRLGQENAQNLIGKQLDAISSASYVASTGDLNIKSFSARGEHITLNAAGKLNTSARSSLRGELDIGQLSRVDSQIDGRAKGTWALDQAKPDAPWRAAFKANASQFSSTLDAVSALISDDINVEGKAQIGTSGLGQVQLTAISGDTRARLDGSLSATSSGDTHLRAKLTGALPRFASGSAEISNIAIDLSADGPLNAVGLTGDVRIAAGSLAGRPVSDIKLALTDATANDLRRGRFHLTGLVDGAPLDANGRLSLDNGMHLNGLQASWENLVLSGNASRGPHGELSGGFEVSGSLPLKDMTGRISATAGFRDDAVTIDAGLTGFSRGNLTLGNVQMAARGSPSDLAWTLDAKGALKDGLRLAPLDLKASGDLKQAEETAVTASATGTFDGEAFATRTPASLKIGDAGAFLIVAIDALGGSLTADVHSHSAILNVDAIGEDIDLSRLAALVGRSDIIGSANVQLNWSGDGDVGNGNASFRLVDVSRGEAGSPQLDINIASQIDNNQVSGVLNITGRDGLSLNGHATTYILVADGIPGFDVNSTPIAYEVKGAGRLGALWALAGIDTIELDGDFTVSAIDQSPLPRLRPTGTFELSNGRFEQAQLGTRLVDMQISTTFDSEQLTLTSASARGFSGGQVTGQGVLNLDPRQKSSVVLDFKGFQAIKRKGQEVKVSGQARVEKAETGATLIGELAIDQAVLDITTLNGVSDVQTVQVTFPAPTDDPKETPRTRKSRAPPFYLDVALVAPREVFVRGRGLDVEMSADLKISGTLQAPIVRGEANVVRGGFDLAGQFFAFSNGQVNINGDPKTALINFAATRTTDGVTTTLGLEGTAAHPRLVLSSQPNLPEDEILSRLLFGRSPSELSALEAAQLTAAITSMANGGGGFNLVSNLRDSIGLDRLSISQSDSGAAQVATGKYLAPDVYLELRSSPDGVADVAVEWEPRSNVTVGTEFKPDGDARVTVQWKKDYD